MGTELCIQGLLQLLKHVCVGGPSFMELGGKNVYSTTTTELVEVSLVGTWAKLQNAPSATNSGI